MQVYLDVTRAGGGGEGCWLWVCWRHAAAGLARMCAWVPALGPHTQPYPHPHARRATPPTRAPLFSRLPSAGLPWRHVAHVLRRQRAGRGKAAVRGDQGGAGCGWVPWVCRAGLLPAEWPAQQPQQWMSRVRASYKLGWQAAAVQSRCLSCCTREVAEAVLHGTSAHLPPPTCPSASPTCPAAIKVCGPGVPIKQIGHTIAAIGEKHK